MIWLLHTPVYIITRLVVSYPIPTLLLVGVIIVLVGVARLCEWSIGNWLANGGFEKLFMWLVGVIIVGLVVWIAVSWVIGNW